MLRRQMQPSWVIPLSSLPARLALRSVVPGMLSSKTPIFKKRCKKKEVCLFVCFCLTLPTFKKKTTPALTFARREAQRGCEMQSFCRIYRECQQPTVRVDKNLAVYVSSKEFLKAKISKRLFSIHTYART